jgi:hypothetical protein
MSKIYPKLKFGEITVQYEDNWLKQTFRYFNYDTTIDPTSTIVILFKDTNEVVSTMDIVPDKTIVYPEPNDQSTLPFNITVNARENPKKLYKRNVIVNEKNVSYLKGFADIYDTQYKTSLPDASIFNCIYYIIDTDYPDVERVVFSIMKRKYGVDSSRFLFSYDPEIINKQQVENIIYRLLTWW